MSSLAVRRTISEIKGCAQQFMFIVIVANLFLAGDNMLISAPVLVRILCDPWEPVHSDSTTLTWMWERYLVCKLIFSKCFYCLTFVNNVSDMDVESFQDNAVRSVIVCPIKREFHHVPTFMPYGYSLRSCTWKRIFIDMLYFSRRIKHDCWEGFQIMLELSCLEFKADFKCLISLLKSFRIKLTVI